VACRSWVFDRPKTIVKKRGEGRAVEESDDAEVSFSELRERFGMSRKPGYKAGGLGRSRIVRGHPTTTLEPLLRTSSA
jgi:hypothetical protein